jgi:hypothetical protein
LFVEYFVEQVQVVCDSFCAIVWFCDMYRCVWFVYFMIIIASHAFDESVFDDGYDRRYSETSYFERRVYCVCQPHDGDVKCMYGCAAVHYYKLMRTKVSILFRSHAIFIFLTVLIRCWFNMVLISTWYGVGMEK